MTHFEARYRKCLDSDSLANASTTPWLSGLLDPPKVSHWPVDLGDSKPLRLSEEFCTRTNWLELRSWFSGVHCSLIWLVSSFRLRLDIRISGSTFTTINSRVGLDFFRCPGGASHKILSFIQIKQLNKYVTYLISVLIMEWVNPGKVQEKLTNIHKLLQDLPTTRDKRTHIITADILSKPLILWYSCWRLKCRKGLTTSWIWKFNF